MVIVSRHGAQLAFVGIFCGFARARLERNQDLRKGGQLRALNRLRAEALATLPLGIGAGEVDGPVWSVSDREGGGLRSSRADTRTPVPPWPHASTMIQWRKPSA